MATKKISLNELRTLVKQIIKEEIRDNREKYDISYQEYKEDFEKYYPTIEDKIKYLTINPLPREWFDMLPYDLKKKITYKNFTIYRFNSLNDNDKIKFAFSDYGLQNLKGIIGHLPSNDYNRKFNRFIGKNLITVGDDVMDLWSENDKIEYFLEFIKHAKRGAKSYDYNNTGEHRLQDDDFTYRFFRNFSAKSRELILKLTDNEYFKKIVDKQEKRNKENWRIHQLKLKRKEIGINGLPKVYYGSGTYAYYDKETDTFYNASGQELKKRDDWRKEKSDLDNLFGGGGDYFDDDN